jgi:hypothetical protein
MSMLLNLQAGNAAVLEQNCPKTGPVPIRFGIGPFIFGQAFFTIQLISC